MKQLRIVRLIFLALFILIHALILRKYNQCLTMTTRESEIMKAVMAGDIKSSSVEFSSRHTQQNMPFVTNSTFRGIDSLQCRRLINNETEQEIPNADLTTDSQVYSNAHDRCSLFKSEYRFYESSVTDEEIDFPIAYSILIYENVQQFARLLSAIYTTNNYYCVHLDAKASLETEKATKAVTSCFPNVMMTSRREAVTYASFGRLQADLNCMEDLLSLENEVVKWKYLINLCGQDFPIRTNEEIVRQLRALKGTNLISGHDVTADEVEVLKRTEWKHEISNLWINGSTELRMVRTNITHPPPPHNPTMRKNMAYNFFSRPFLRWVLYESKEAKDILNWAKPTYSPDEHFWLLVNTLPGAPGGRNVTSYWGVVRYIRWLINAPTSDCHGYRRHDICVFGTGDLPGLVQRYELFINKLDIRFDSDVMTCLRQWLHDRNNYKIPSYLIPNWV